MDPRGLDPIGGALICIFLYFLCFLFFCMFFSFFHFKLYFFFIFCFLIKWCTLAAAPCCGLVNVPKHGAGPESIDYS